MLKTNTKKAKQNLYAYMIKQTSEDYDHFSVFQKTKDIKDLKVAIAEDFKRRFDHSYFGDTCLQDLFRSYANELALDIFDYIVEPTAKNIVASILEETEEEKNKYTEEQATELLTYMLFKACYDDILKDMYFIGSPLKKTYICWRSKQ